jgi:DNA uptake protein ComE-like DNA-binding protein
MKFHCKFLLFILLLALPALACGGDATPTSTNGSNSVETLSPTPQRPSFGQTSESTPTPKPDLPIITIRGARVNIRSGPGINYPVIQTLDQNDTAPATGFNSGQTWVQIELPDSTPGWVSADLVDIDNPDEMSIVTNTSPAQVATTSSQQPPSSDNNGDLSGENPDGNTENPSPVATATSQPPPEGCVDINHASKEDLKRMIHIDDERADQIIVLRTQRPFRSIDELTGVSGIGAVRLREIKEQGLACVTP